MEKDSFNLLVTNLFIGLLKAHPSLMPAAKELPALGYKLLAVESSFHATGGRVNPELLAGSEKQSHTFLAEWTAGEDAESKRDQIIRYLAVTETDLIEKAFLPAAVASTNSLVVVIREEAMTSFAEMFNQKPFVNRRNRLCLSTFSYDKAKGYELRYDSGDVADAELSKFLKAGFVVQRIPRGYMRVLVSDLNNKTLLLPVVQSLASMVVKRKIGDFTAAELCEQLYDVWALFDASKRASIAKSVNRLLRSLHRIFRS